MVLKGSMEFIGDIFFLVRLDYMIFDEMRKISDFKIYFDFRFVGVGMIGVVYVMKLIDVI